MRNIDIADDPSLRRQLRFLAYQAIILALGSIIDAFGIYILRRAYYF